MVEAVTLYLVSNMIRVSPRACSMLDLLNSAVVRSQLFCVFVPKELMPKISIWSPRNVMFLVDVNGVGFDVSRLGPAVDGASVVLATDVGARVGMTEGASVGTSVCTGEDSAFVGVSVSATGERDGATGLVVGAVEGESVTLTASVGLPVGESVGM